MLLVLLDGEIQCTKKVGDRQVPWLTLVLSPFLTGTNSPQSALPCHCTSNSRATYWSLILKLENNGVCPSISRDLLIVTAQRTQDLGTVSMQAEN